MKIVPDIDMVLVSDWKQVHNFRNANFKYVNKLINIFDQNALELALRIKDAMLLNGTTAEICILHAGDSTGDPFLKSTLSLHADAAFRIDCKGSDRDDPEKTAWKIEQAVQEIGPFDLVFFGMQASPLDHAQTGLAFAERIGWPCITHVSEVTLQSGEAVVVHQNDYGMEKIQMSVPVVLVVGNTCGLSLRLPTLKDKLGTDQKKVEILTCSRGRNKEHIFQRKRMVKMTARCSERRSVIINAQKDEQKAVALLKMISDEANM